MKKRSVLFFLCCIMLLTNFNGCKKDTGESEIVIETETQQPVATEIVEVVDPHEGEVKSLFTGEWISEEIACKRPIAMMIENTSAACPQYGISKADVIYECPVEGGITRLLAIFQDYGGMEKIGNVRSCRPYYVYFANEFDAIYMHAGASTEGEELLDSNVIDYVNGTSGVGGPYYYRDKGKKAPHNLYTSSAKIEEAIASFGFDAQIDSAYTGHYIFAKDDMPVNLTDGIPAEALTLYYPDADPWFLYNAADGLYYRYEFNKEQIDGMNNQQIAVKNIILQECSSSFYSTESNKLKIDCTSGGSGKYFTNGKCIDITWTRDANTKITHYYDMNGNEITLNQGKTWVAIIQSKSASKNRIYSTIEEFEANR